MTTRKIEQPPIPAPECLSEHGKALWASVVPRRVRTPERLVLLQVGLEALDGAFKIRSAIDEQGMVSVTEATQAKHINPLCRLEREYRQLFAKIWGQLGLDKETFGREWRPE
jgi:hypothetical protein